MTDTQKALIGTMLAGALSLDDMRAKLARLERLEARVKAGLKAPWVSRGELQGWLEDEDSLLTDPPEEARDGK